METIYEKNGFKVETNGSDEFFITSQNGNVRLRVSPSYNSITATAGNGNGILIPSNINGLPAFIAQQEPRRAPSPHADFVVDVLLPEVEGRSSDKNKK